LRGAGIGVVLLVAGVTLIIAFPDDRMQEMAETPEPQPTTGSTEEAAPETGASAVATEQGGASEATKVATDISEAGEPTGPTEPQPVRAPAMSVADYLANCLKVDAASFVADCLGKRVEGDLYFMSPDAKGTKQLMATPGNHEDVFSVTFTTVPDWGSKEPFRWTGRRETIMATIAARSEDGGAAFDRAEIVRNDTWRDRATEMIKAREDVLDAMWAQAGGVSLWVAMRNNGSKRDKDAEQLCLEVWRAGRPEGQSIAITILDAARIQHQAEIGKAYCR
jgi:hypothetical protein